MGRIGFSDGGGCSNRWQEKMVPLYLVASQDMVPGQFRNWRGIVQWILQSTGSKNGSSLSVLPWLRRTMPGKSINWLGVVVDSAVGG